MCYKRNAGIELQKNKEELEDIVQNKSSTLMEITEKLTNEIAERKQAEKNLRSVKDGSGS
uniref:Uncharacterized protein n=1 Tax=uncultured Desulfobacterium sp. TaxID=201089 RepID=E1YAP1_9BACT|nr:unknown protein [uncultured Desulfobacterium sp.]